MAMIANAFVGRFLDVLQHLLTEEVQMIGGVKDDLQRLQKKLMKIKAVLSDAERRRIQDEATNLWLSELKDVMYDADDIIDLCIIKAHKLGEADEELLPASASSSVRTHRCRFPLFSSCFTSMSSIPFRHEIGKEIQKLNQRVDAISKDYQYFTLKDSSNNSSSSQDVGVTQVNRNQTCALLPPHDLVGTQIKSTADKIIDSLVKEEDERVLVFAIVGLGGIGKTTLAQKIYNHQKVKNSFKKRLWVCVSQSYSVTELLKEIIRSAGCDDYGNKNTKAELMPLLLTVLEGTRFLLVLDDVWRADVWENLLQAPLEQAGKSFSRVLITSRNENIGKRMGAIQTHQVNTLDENDGWVLLSNIALKNKSDEVIRGLQEIGMLIVKKCDGLPLAITVVAGVLKEKDSRRSEWVKVYEDHAWSVTGELPEEVRGALYLSYEDLPSQVKQCFLFCSLFPEDYLFDRSGLIQWWVAEGFVTSQEDSLLEDIAEDYYNILISRSLLHLSPLSFNRGACTMHDLTRSLALFLTKDESRFFNRNETTASIKSSKLRRLAIHDREETSTVLNAIEIPQCLRTFRAIKCLWMKTEEIFQRFTRLRILDLRKTTIEIIPESIQNLYHLRYLSLDQTRVTKLPETLGSLTNLQFLDLNGCEFLHNLPKAITRLCNLRRLGLMETPVSYVPTGIGELRNLNDLRGFVAGDGDDNCELQSRQCQLGCSLDELQLMSQLRTLVICRLERVQTGRVQALKDKRRLKTLRLEWSEDADQSLISGVTEEICESLSPSPDLENLIVVCFPGYKFPKWITVLHNLTLLSLFNCLSCQVLPPLGKLQQLKILHIQSAVAVVNIGLEFLGLDTIDGPSNRDVLTAFPRLEKLSMCDMRNWEEWTNETNETESIDGGRRTAIKLLPLLQELEIFYCPKLRSLPEGLQHATALKRLHLEGTDSLREIKNIPTLETLTVHKSLCLESISDLPALREMYIVYPIYMLKSVEKVNTLQRLTLELHDDWIECLPEWLLRLIQDAKANDALQKFHLVCNKELRERCTEGGQYWPMLCHIPEVEVSSTRIRT